MAENCPTPDDSCPLTSLVAAVHQRQEEVVIPTIKRIEEQVVATNSRVTKLEAWRERAVGAIGIVALIVSGLAIPVIIMILKGQFGG